MPYSKCLAIKSRVSARQAVPLHQPVFMVVMLQVRVYIAREDSPKVRHEKVQHQTLQSDGELFWC